MAINYRQQNGCWCCVHAHVEEYEDFKSKTARCPRLEATKNYYGRVYVTFIGGICDLFSKGTPIYSNDVVQQINNEPS